MATKKKRTQSDSVDDYDTRLGNLKLAARLIGDTMAARLAWVVKFIEEDPKDWHPAVRAMHGDCLNALGHGGFPPNVAGEVDLPDPLAADEVEALHTEIRATLRDLLIKNPTGPSMVMIPTEGLTEGLMRVSAAGKKPAQFAPTYGHRFARTAVMQAVKTLILQAGSQLIACPIDQRPFIANGKRLFCSSRCAQRARDDRRPS